MIDLRRKKYVYIVMSAMMIVSALFTGCSVSLTDDAMLIKNISFQEERAADCIGQSVKLNPKIEPGFALNKTLQYTTSDESIATVSDDGTVTGKNYGSVIIKCSATDGSGKSAEITVDVVPDQTELKSASKTVTGEIKVTWKKIANASKYQIMLSTDEDFGKGSETCETTDGKTTSFSKTGLTPGQTYYVKVRACVKKNGQEYRGAWSEVKKTELKSKAKALVMIDGKTGETLYSKNPDEQLAIASITKIMTVVVALENEDMTDKFKVSGAADRASGSTAGLKQGETVTLKDLIAGMLLPSGNDAAVCAAEGIAGSEKEFVKMMNEKAKELGLKNTVYYNSTGLTPRNADGKSTGKENVSSAADMAKLAKYAYETFPELDEIAAMEKYTMSKTELQNEREVLTTNCLKIFDSKYYYPACTGLKTGTTPEAGKCLLATAERNGRTLIVCLLGDMSDNGEYRWLEPVELFESGFLN